MPPPLSQGPEPVRQLATIARVSPNLSQSPMARLQREQYELGPVSILDVSRMDPHFEYQAERIHQNMPFSPVYFLARVIAPRPPFSVVLAD